MAVTSIRWVEVNGEVVIAVTTPNGRVHVPVNEETIPVFQQAVVRFYARRAPDVVKDLSADFLAEVCEA